MCRSSYVWENSENKCNVVTSFFILLTPCENTRFHGETIMSISYYMNTYTLTLKVTRRLSKFTIKFWAHGSFASLFVKSSYKENSNFSEIGSHNMTVISDGPINYEQTLIPQKDCDWLVRKYRSRVLNAALPQNHWAVRIRSPVRP